MLLNDFQAYQFDFGCCPLDDFELILPDVDRFVELGEALVDVEYQSADGEVVFIFGQGKLEHLVDFLNLQACREDVFLLVELLGDVGSRVVFDLDVLEVFFHPVLQGEEARCASELVDYHCQALFLLHEDFHQLLGCHGLGDDGNLPDVGGPVLGMT